MRGKILEKEAIVGIAEKYAKTAAQIILRWDLQHGVVTIPKSTHAERIAENAEIFDFALSEADMQTLDAMDAGARVGPDPYNFAF